MWCDRVTSSLMGRPLCNVCDSSMSGGFFVTAARSYVLRLCMSGPSCCKTEQSALATDAEFGVETTGSTAGTAMDTVGISIPWRETEDQSLLAPRSSCITCCYLSSFLGILDPGTSLQPHFWAPSFIRWTTEYQTGLQFHSTGLVFFSTPLPHPGFLHPGFLLLSRDVAWAACPLSPSCPSLVVHMWRSSRE